MLATGETFGGTGTLACAVFYIFIASRANIDREPRTGKSACATRVPVLLEIQAAEQSGPARVGAQRIVSGVRFNH